MLRARLVLRLFAGASGGTVLHEQEDYLDNTASWAWQQLSTGKLATVDCWAEVYVENLAGVPVWFDDLEIQTGALPVAVVVQETHYDPWGLELAGIGYNASGNPEHRWKYNGGVERLGDFGLGWDMADWRAYDPVLGRFHGVDMLAGIAPGLTPYRFGFNNPISCNDPEGLWERTNNGWRTSDAGEIRDFMAGLKAAGKNAKVVDAQKGNETSELFRIVGNNPIVSAYHGEERKEDDAKFSSHNPPVANVLNDNANEDYSRLASQALAPVPSIQPTVREGNALLGLLRLARLVQWNWAVAAGTTATAVGVHGNSDKNNNKHLVYAIVSYPIAMNTINFEIEKYGITDETTWGYTRMKNQVIQYFYRTVRLIRFLIKVYG